VTIASSAARPIPGRTGRRSSHRNVTVPAASTPPISSGRAVPSDTTGVTARAMSPASAMNW
jgi:hypothetical protein